MSILVPPPVADPLANAAAIRDAMKRTPSGGELVFGCGNWVVDGAGSELFFRDTPIAIRGEGMGSMISLAPTMGPKTDLFRFAPRDSGNGCNWSVSGLMIRRDKVAGRNAFTLDTTAKGAFLQNLLIARCYCEPLGGYFVDCVNAEPNEGLFGSTIADNVLSMGIRLVGSGDSNHVLRNCIGGATEGVILGCRGTAGATEIVGNLITAAKGAIVILAGRAVFIGWNQLEQQAVPTGTNRCLIDLAGTATNRLQHPTAIGNVIQTGDGSVFSPEPDAMRLGFVDDPWIDANTFTMNRAAGVRVAKGCQRPGFGSANNYVGGVAVVWDRNGR